MSILYAYTKIRDLEGMYLGNYVSVRGRVVWLFYDKAYMHAYLTLADDSGMVLAKFKMLLRRRYLWALLLTLEQK